MLSSVWVVTSGPAQEPAKLPLQSMLIPAMPVKRLGHSQAFDWDTEFRCPLAGQMTDPARHLTAPTREGAESQAPLVVTPPSRPADYGSRAGSPATRLAVYRFTLEKSTRNDSSLKLIDTTARWMCPSEMSSKQ